ncbi:gp53-like domain-containing protein, partial [Phytopseudomonas daroniae]|uniref:gp53-like domain-containing protein n=1 Tax=Phytopseudomonas daroniae TaxID=2487519 RepID=UPI003CC63589
TGNAATATKLVTPRTINGVAFDGSANITIADGTKEPSYAAGTAAQYWRGNKTWRDFATDVRAAVLTGLSTATATAVAATDTVLAALGKLQAQVTGLSTSKLNANANAVSATKLQTARTIGGVAFDGTANINLPGVNAAGNQSTTGNAATATKLVTPRTINGVAFDGSANITIADGTKEPSYAAGTTAQYRRGDKTWRDFATDVRAAVLTGLSTATATAVAAADTVLVAIGKLQAQVATKANLASPAFTGTPTVPTAAVAANNTQSANTAWVKARIAELPASPKNTWGIVGTSAWWKCGDTGVIRQFGLVTEAAGPTDYRSFPIAFPNACLSLNATRTSGWNTASEGTCSLLVSNSQFTVLSGIYNGNQIFWEATGY